MSGGVDSTAAALLLKQQGVHCEGAVLELFEGSGAADEARAAAERLQIPLHVFNLSADFQAHVTAPFIKEYKAGRTPNPCVECNRFLKFGRLLQCADDLGFDRVATGHYARIEREGGRYLLKKGKDLGKDQSYVLYTLTQEQLARIIFPLGNLTKEDVRELSAVQKKESQDICFIPDGDYAGFIARTTGESFPKGRFMGTDGRDLGEHRGVIHYTVGQRRGLGVAHEKPLYVKEIKPKENVIILGTEETLYTRALTVNNGNLIAFPNLDKPLRAAVKIRYRHPGQPAVITQTDSQTFHIEFDQPQRAVTPGQAAVIYDGDVVIGGGTIE